MSDFDVAVGGQYRRVSDGTLWLCVGADETTGTIHLVTWRMRTRWKRSNMRSVSEDTFMAGYEYVLRYAG